MPETSWREMKDRGKEGVKEQMIFIYLHSEKSFASGFLVH